MWSGHHALLGDEDLTMIGRAEQVDVARGLSLTSACGTCCQPTFFDGWCDPGSVTGFPGDTSQFTAKQRKQDCYGNILSATTVLDASWTSTNTAVATVNANGLAKIGKITTEVFAMISL